MHKVLIIGYVWPEPDSSAAGSRMMQLIALFRKQDWQVTFASPAATSDHMVDLDAYAVETASIKLNCSSFDKFISRLQPTIVLFDRFMMEEQFGWRVEKQCPDALRILDTEDLHCLRQARHNALKADREVCVSDLNSELAMREIAAIYRCDLSLIISTYEFHLLKDQFAIPDQILLQLPFMLSLTRSDQFKSYADREGYISIGNFRHAPNWDAVLYLKQTLWPLIRQLQPKAQLSIYGAYPPPKATQLDNPKQGFHIKGWAKNSTTVMQQARICLAPLRFGAGLKGKLVEAMLCGTPSITTSIGAEAMHDSLPWSGVIANDETLFAQSAVNLYQSEDNWYQAQSQGMNIISSVYDAETLGEKLIDKINAIKNNLTVFRENNFTGSMLRHHSMQSTRYMAQWIEAKNRLEKLSS